MLYSICFLCCIFLVVWLFVCFLFFGIYGACEIIPNSVQEDKVLILKNQNGCYTYNVSITQLKQRSSKIVILNSESKQTPYRIAIKTFTLVECSGSRSTSEQQYCGKGCMREVITTTKE